MEKLSNNIENKNFLTPITPEDAKEVQDFILETWKEFFNAGNREEAINKRKDLQNPSEFYKSHNGDFWCIKEGGKIVATIAVHEIIYQNKLNVGFLRRFFVEKDHRSKGLGDKMLKFVEDYSVGKKWEYLMFGVDESMERNKQFYGRHGYEEFTEDVPQEILDDNDTWYLRKKLENNLK